MENSRQSGPQRVPLNVQLSQRVQRAVVRYLSLVLYINFRMQSIVTFAKYYNFADFLENIDNSLNEPRMHEPCVDLLGIAYLALEIKAFLLSALYFLSLLIHLVINLQEPFRSLLKTRYLLQNAYTGVHATHIDEDVRPFFGASDDKI